MEKILTIVVPTYNMENYLRHCLDSLIVPQEEMEKLEVLVINDGSTDNSSAIAHEYQDKYPDTFRVIDKENGNYGSCVNRGLKEAKGKYIKILDADDSFDTNSFIKFLKILKKSDSDLILTDYKTVHSNGTIVSTQRWSEAFNIISGEKMSFKLFSSRYQNFISVMHGITYKTEIFAGLNYNQHEGIPYTDVQWCFMPIAHVENVFYSNISLYLYTVGRFGQTMENIGKHIPQLMIVVNDMLKFYQTGNWNRVIYSKYFACQINRQLYIIYEFGLFKKSYPIEILIEFDKKLFLYYQSFYRDSEDFRFHHLPIVKFWRKSNNMTIPVWIKFGMWIYKFYSNSIKSNIDWKTSK